MSKVICITGTPGVGKSTLARKLVKKYSWNRLDVSKHYKVLATSYNRSRQCYDIDMKKFAALVKEKKKEGDVLVIDSHIAQLLPKRLVDLCVVLVCPDLKLLKRRLQGRKYSKKKVEENVQSEIFQVCLEQSKNHDVLVFDVTRNSQAEILKNIHRSVSHVDER